MSTSVEKRHSVLGLLYFADTDTITAQLPDIDDTFWENPLTMRKLLSLQNSIYDPLGWIEPYRLYIKLLMQTEQSRDLDLDHEVTQSTMAKLYHSMQKWQDIPPIPRYFLKFSNVRIFSDACSQAYGCAIYVDNILVTSKSRIVPIKEAHWSTSRHELCGFLNALDWISYKTLT